MMRTQLNLFTALVVILAFTLELSHGAQVEVNPRIDHQQMMGWGASASLDIDSLMQRSDQDTTVIRTIYFNSLLGNMGLTAMGINIDAAFQSEEGGAYDWDILQAQRWMLQEAQTRRRITYFWARVSSPPAWMKSNGDSRHGGRLVRDRYDDYANYLADYFLLMEDRYGYRINGLSIFNEPGSGNDTSEYESTSTTSAEYRDILKVVHATFEARGLEHVQFLGPDSRSITGENGALSEYLPAILADSVAAAALDIITVHQYGDMSLLRGEDSGDDWAGLRELASSYGKPVWQSEASIDGRDLATKDIHEGLRVAKLIWIAVTEGNVAAWNYNQFFLQVDSTRSSAIIGYTFQRWGWRVEDRYRHNVLQHWTRYVTPGSVRIETSCDDDRIFVSTFRNAYGFVIIGFNTSEDTVATKFNVPGIKGTIPHIRTSSSERYTTLHDLAPDSSFFNATMIPHSISTFLVSSSQLAPDDQPVPIEPELQAYPNPFNSTVTIEWSLQRSQEVTFSLTDILGREVRRIDAGYLERGDHKAVIKAKGLAPGIYYLGMEGHLQPRKAIVLVK